MNKGLFVLFLLFASNVFGQHSWVYFTDRCDGNDDVICETYITELETFDIEIIGTSKWFNAACVKGEPTFLNVLSFVDRVEPLAHYNITRHAVSETMDELSYGDSDWQLKMLQLDSFHKWGFTGNNVTIALFDAGFYQADTVHAFDSLWDQGRIKGYWDFLTNDTSLFWEYDGHGKNVLSIVGANWPDSIIGAAPGANFLLARTEDVNSETHLEEFAWVKAMEWAEEQGADIIHSSLGYSVFDSLQGDYSYADMDGNSTIITRATDIAFSKGIFITNSAGNEGDDDWHYITAPCDGKHVLCVGAVDSARNHAAFSSYGPSVDGRIKPEVMAMGKGVTFVNNQAHLQTGNGTSYSGPLMAGFVACLKEAWPNTTNQQIFEAIIQSADRYNNPDTAYGYGIPNIIKADSLLALTSSIADMLSPLLNVYPNPTEGLVTINAQHQINSIQVIDFTGRLIQIHEGLLASTIQLDLFGLMPNMYVLEIQFANGNAIWHKIIKTNL
ncbi:MAG: subtilisin family serine protease [Bacteroidia bacterium]|jgi:subtilisin family serine protease